MEGLLKSERVRLRALEMSDVDAIFEWDNDTEVWQYGCNSAPYSRHQIENYIATNTSDIYADRQLRLMIESTAGERIGVVGLYNFSPFDLRAWVGILISPEQRGRGYGVEAVRLIADYAEHYLGLHQLAVEIPVGNERSVRLFEHCGFKQSGIMRDWLKTGLHYADMLLMQRVFTR